MSDWPCPPQSDDPADWWVPGSPPDPQPGQAVCDYDPFDTDPTPYTKTLN